MAFYTMYGINGVGKDTVANVLHERNPNLRLTSESRMLMYLLGITDAYDASYRPTKAQYLALETTPQEIIVAVEGGAMRDLAGELAAGKHPVLNLGHLIFATYLNGNVEYIQKPKESWLATTGDVFVQLIAPPEVVLQRRAGEATVRERVLDGTEEIARHQALCDAEWDRLVGSAVTARCAVVPNIELMQCATDVEAVLYAGQ